MAAHRGDHSAVMTSALSPKLSLLHLSQVAMPMLCDNQETASVSKRHERDVSRAAAPLMGA